MLFTILKNKDKIKDAVLKDNVAGRNITLHGADHAKLENVLYEWFSQQRAAGIPISRPMLKAKIMEFALRMNTDGFVVAKVGCSISRIWKELHYIKYCANPEVLLKLQSVTDFRSSRKY
ncbi:hypothetical protein PR048_004491 [Dryococelus australis]|uniref:HTH CENPB-type domain-containing protein n=1 Tax=Dryococelus australis TaxID=614101 RepID=A0ABQ9I5L5_9NEOP|nr:hypothetical protein PR048_004491 [Dryococelus australis]